MKRVFWVAASIALVTTSTMSMPAPAQNQSSFWRQVPTLLDVDGRLADIDKKIVDAQAAGQLTAAQAQTYKDELKRIADQQTAFKADGKVSVWESMRLSYDLDRLGRDIDLNLGQRTVGLTDIDGRQADMQAQLTAALQAGRLTTQETAGFRSEMDRIAAQEAQFRADGQLTSTELLTLSLDLDKLSTSIARAMRDPTVAPDINVTQAEIETRINAGVAQGKLTSLQASELKGELARIASLKASYTASGGQLTTEEKLLLAIDLERLNSRVSTYLPATATASGIDAFQDQVARKILEAQNSGRITYQAAVRLRGNLDRIAAQEATYRADGTLNETETLELYKELEALSARVDRVGSEVAGGGPSIEERRAEARARVDAAVAGGRLSAQALAELQSDLRRIETRYSFFRADGTLSDGESLTLASDLDALNLKVDNMVSVLPGVNVKQRQIGDAIDDGLDSGRLSAQAAARLQRELERISSLETTFQASEGRLDAEESATLSREYDNLIARIDRAVARGTSAPPVSPPPVSTPPVTTVPTNDTPVIVGTVAPDTRGHWAEPYVAMLSSREVIGGFPDGSFRPNDDITRAQFAAIAVKALNLPPAASGRNFTDVPEKYWGARAIASVSNAGLVTGFPDGTFKPEDKITRAQALVILSKAVKDPNESNAALDKYEDGPAVPDWAKKSVATAANAHIIVNYPNAGAIRPNALATRAEVAALVYRTMLNKGADLPTLRIGVLSISQ